MAPAPKGRASERRAGTLANADASRPRSEERARAKYNEREERKRARAARGDAPRLEEQTSIEDALSTEHELGFREGQKATGGSSTPATSSSSSSSSSPALSSLSGGSLQLGAPLLVETLIIGADELVNEGRFPLPSRLLVAFALFTGLGMFKQGPPRNTAAAIGWGLVVATFYSTVAPGSNALAAIGAFIGGKGAGSNFGKGGGTAASTVGPLPPAGPQSEAGSSSVGATRPASGRQSSNPRLPGYIN